MLPDSDGVGAVWLVFTNSAASPDTILYGACSFAAVLYPAGRGDPAWQSVPRSSLPCIDIGYALVLPPGATRSVLAARLAGVPALTVPQTPVGVFDAAAVLNDKGRLRLVPAARVTCTTGGCGW